MKRDSLGQDSRDLRDAGATVRTMLHYSTVLNPGLVSMAVSIVPSLMMKMPGNLLSQDLLAAGTYSRALASMVVTPGTCAASPAFSISDASA